MSELAVPPCQFWQGLTNIKNRIISNYLCIPPAPSYAPACPLWVVSFCQFRKNRLPKKVKKATKSARNPPPPPAKKNNTCTYFAFLRACGRNEVEPAGGKRQNRCRPFFLWSRSGTKKYGRLKPFFLFIKNCLTIFFLIGSTFFARRRKK